MPQTISAMQQKGVAFEKLTQNEERQLYFLTVCTSKKFQFLSLSKPLYFPPSEGDQPWDFFGRNDAKAESPVLWPPYAKS